MNPTPSVTTDALDRLRRFTEALQPHLLDLIGTEDVVSALIDRSLVQDEMERGAEASPDDLVALDRIDRAFRAAAPTLLDRTDVALFKDDEPVTHWWWHIEQLVLGRASDLLLDVPKAAAAKGVHPHTIRAAIKNGHLPARRLARGFLVHRRDLERWQPRSVGRPRGTRQPEADTLLESFDDARAANDSRRAAQIAEAFARGPSTPRRHVALARHAFDNGDYEGALAAAREALGEELSSRERATARLIEGISLLGLGRPGEAKTALESVEEPAPSDARSTDLAGLVAAALAEAHLALGHRHRAVELARTAAERAPGVPELTYLLARMEWHADLAWDALEHVVAYRALRPDDDAGRLLHAAVAGLLGDRTGDEHWHRRVIEIVGPLAETSADAMQSIGLAWTRLGRTSDAERVLQHLVGRSGDDEAATHGARQVADAIAISVARRHPDGATATIDRVEALVGRSAATGAARARIAASTGDVEATCAGLGITLDQVGTAGPEACQLVAIALINGGRGSEALLWLRRAAEGSEDPEIVAVAISGALACQDPETAKLGLERLATREDVSGRQAETALELLPNGESTGRAPESLASPAPGLAPVAAWAEADARGRAAPDSPWEGIHPRVSRILEDLARSLLR